MKRNYKNLIISVSVIIFIILAIIVYFKFIHKKPYLSIESIGSSNLSYVYGPNNQTNIEIKKGQIFNFKIISNKVKQVKCFTTNENIAVISEKDTVLANSTGNVSIYCKLNNLKSNELSVRVGE